MGYKYRRAKTAPEKDALFAPVTLKLPLTLFNAIKNAAEQKQMPVARLIAWLIDDELTFRNGAFDYPCELPTTTFIEKAYINEAGKIMRYLRKVGAQGIDQLMLSRREIGIPDKEQLLLGVRELLETSAMLPIEYVFPKWITYFKHAPDYRVIGIRQTSEERRQREIEKTKKYLEALEKGEEIDE